jgi:pSer/pThr/pTyr-binding forkhead associated (FHA) protein
MSGVRFRFLEGPRREQEISFPGPTLRVGRSRDCDLVVPDEEGPASSGHHAEVVHSDGAWWIQDLASTNGTFVNGERVSERRLRPGDRIEVGSSVVTFCEVAAGLEPSTPDQDQEQTVMLERRPQAESFRGDLAEIPPFALLQMLELGRKSGLLEIDSDRGIGRLWLGDGAPVHAETKDQTGFDAALAIAQASTGRFRFQPDVDCDEPTIQASVTELLLEASRVLDESTR